MNLDTRLSIPSQVMSRLVGDETVLLDLSSGIYFGLDGVGKRIWETVTEGRSLEETAKIITTEFEVEETRAQADVVEFAKDLVERGLLTR
jgi:Coenzyme PQQ synthesis protein D (PqqD)